MKTKDEARNEIKEEIKKLRSNGMYAQSLFRFSDGSYGKVVLHGRIIQTSQDTFTQQLDRWLVSLYERDTSGAQVMGFLGPTPRCKKTLTLDGDAALIEWYAEEGPYADIQA